MSDAEPAPPWVWQGFFGPMAIAAAAKASVDALPTEVVGARVPLHGDPPVPVDVHGEVGMFAIMTRPAAPVATPAGLEPARAEIVGRLVGA